MASEHLWPAGRIVATLLSPFGPAMVNMLARLLGAGRVLDWIGAREPPEPPLSQPVVVTGVSIEVGSLQGIIDALPSEMQGGPRTVILDQVSLEKLDAITNEIQHLRTDVQKLRDDISDQQKHTYTMAGTNTD